MPPTSTAPASPAPNDPRLRVALETTLILHGVPRTSSRALATDLAQTVRANGGIPTLIGVVSGQPRIGLSDTELDTLLAAPPESVRKVNTANLGAALFRKQHGATTVSTTMELAAAAGISLFTTGGLGGVHRSTSQRERAGEGGLLHSSPPTSHLPPATCHPLPLDISSDLAALTRFPIAVVCSGVKSILDVAATRELLETLGVPVIGFRTDEFPAFYMRRSPDQRVGQVDARFDDPAELARFVRFELARHPRGIVICNPIPPEHEINPTDWSRWLAAAEAQSTQHGAAGRDVTPALLAALHEVSGGATLRANIELAKSNAALAAQIAATMFRASQHNTSREKPASVHSQ